jgi:hypothetical protein
MEEWAVGTFFKAAFAELKAFTKRLGKDDATGLVNSQRHGIKDVYGILNGNGVNEHSRGFPVQPSEQMEMGDPGTKAKMATSRWPLHR